MRRQCCRRQCLRYPHSFVVPLVAAPVVAVRFSGPCIASHRLVQRSIRIPSDEAALLSNVTVSAAPASEAV